MVDIALDCRQVRQKSSMYLVRYTLIMYYFNHMSLPSSLHATEGSPLSTNPVGQEKATTVPMSAMLVFVFNVSLV